MTIKKGKSDLLPIKRRLRSNQTPAEQLLWAKLRRNQIHGLKFCRQHGIGSYIVDFFCPERALVIEVDGDVHASENKIKKDRQRENNLYSLGIRVIRYNNDDILHNLDGVLENIGLHVIKSFTSPSPSFQRRGRQKSDSSSKSLLAANLQRRIFLTKETNQGASFPVTIQEFGFSPNPLPRAFFTRPTLTVARELLGKILIRETSSGLLPAKIVDVEAYVGPRDKACHASKGRTKRTEIMFGPSGFTYVYLIYGMYHCLNIVTEQEEYPAAILIRGLEIPGENHPGALPTRIEGPGRVCRLLEIDRTHNGLDTTLGTALWIEDHNQVVSPKQIQALPRIGIDYAGEWAKKLWRFCLPAPLSSRKRRAPLR
jgi:DNA-3-methyladenine glycosylase